MGSTRFSHCEWKRAGTTLRGSLHVTRQHGAPWFVFSHGFTGHRLGPGYLFVRLSRELAGIGWSSLRFDFGGSGESEGTFPRMTIESMQNDLLSAVRLVRKRYAPSALVLAGHSFGGMIASLCCGKARPDGLVLLSPVGDPMGLVYRRSAIMKAGPNAQGFYENGPHEMSIKFLRGLKTAEPVLSMAETLRGSLLLVQGDSDASISVAESGSYVKAAQKAGIDTTYHLLKNADHNFATVSHFKTLCSIVLTWTKERFR